MNVVRNGPELFVKALPLLGSRVHKYTRGVGACILGDSLGAGFLSVAGMLAVSPGLVVAVDPRAEGWRDETLLAGASKFPQVLWTHGEGWDDLRKQHDPEAIVWGPGIMRGTLGEDYFKCELERHLDTAPCVFDAGVLRYLGVLGSLKDRFKNRLPILTPHEGEFCAMWEGEGSRAERAAQAAETWGAVVVLKGHHSCVALPDGSVVINGNDTPTLSIGGAGDVLAGLIGGLLARGLPASKAALAGVWIHGEAGCRLERELDSFYSAWDLVEIFPEILKKLFRVFATY